MLRSHTFRDILRKIQ